MLGEEHFFDRPLDAGDLTKTQIDNYEKRFSTKKPIFGEKSPSYCYLQYCMDRIHRYDPKIKLVLILRKPVSRAFSQYNMCLNQIGKTLNDVTDDDIIAYFEGEAVLSLKGIRANSRGYNVVRGYYDEILEYLFSKFQKDQIYIGISEKIRADKQRYYNEIMRFLGSTKHVQIKEADVHIREYKRAIPRRLEIRLREIYRPHNTRLYAMLGESITEWETYYQTIDQ